MTGQSGEITGGKRIHITAIMIVLLAGMGAIELNRVELFHDPAGGTRIAIQFKLSLPTLARLDNKNEVA